MQKIVINTFIVLLLISLLLLSLALYPFFTLDPDQIYIKHKSNFPIISYLLISAVIFIALIIAIVNFAAKLFKINNDYIIYISVISINNVIVISNILFVNNYHEYIQSFEISYILKAIWLISLLAIFGIAIFFYLLKDNEEKQNSLNSNDYPDNNKKHDIEINKSKLLHT
ncbi:MAG: hypothetical protein H6940_09525 [Burkholderiales bacterium]|nr:hypothetical protein [Burkholderiales bacterium]